MIVGSVDRTRAQEQHAGFIRAVRRAGGHVITVPFVHGAFDSVFAKDNALYMTRRAQTHAMLARPRFSERQMEQTARMRDLAHAGITVEPYSADFEGGDVIVLPGRCAFLGYGFRSSRSAALVVERFLGLPVIPLELIDPALYHLDTALAVLSDGTALVCDDALSPVARRGLREVCNEVIPVSRAEALRFAVNLLEIGDAVVTGTDSEEVSAILESLGKRTIYTPLDEFHRAGGSAACLLAVLDHAAVATAETTAMRSTAA